MNRLELIEEFKNQLGNLSYYNAASGSWSSEKDARNRCKKRLKDLADKLLDNDLSVADLKALSGTYLVTPFDYLPTDRER